MRLPIGNSDFKKIIEDEFDIVDKTLLIQEILDDPSEVILITRPRRWGKTFGMSMMKYFFSMDVDGKSTKNLFQNLKISQAEEKYLKHQAKYPVIFLTLKDVKQSTFEKGLAGIGKAMSKLYTEYEFLLRSPKLYEHEKEIFESILKQNTTEENLASSLQDLIDYLSRHYDQKIVVLIDEYDTPIQSGYLHGYYNEIIPFFRHFFGSALKDNPCLFKSVLTGILRISKESLFSGLNNLRVYSVMNSNYSTHFGFTEDELSYLLKENNLVEKSDDIKKWYNGYQIGSTILYNPWSMINCLQDHGDLKPYWVFTSDNALVRTLLIKSSWSFKEQFELLLEGKSVEFIIDENFSFPDLDKQNEMAVWCLLLMTGYLKVVSRQDTIRGPLCKLAIPNLEIRNLYQIIIEQWLSEGTNLDWYTKFLNSLLTGDMTEFEKGLKIILEQTTSVHDTARDPEAFYHGLFIGLTASLHGYQNYETRSNRESGYGRYDYMILSRDLEKPTILMEFKKVELPENKKNSDKAKAPLTKAAKKALKQMDDLNYILEAKSAGVTKILKIGLAFCGKRFALVHNEIK